MRKMAEVVRVKIQSGSGQVEIDAPVEIAMTVLRSIAKRGRQLQGRHLPLRGEIEQLIEEGFFDTERRLGDIKTALEPKGLVLETTKISPILWRDFVKPGIILRKGTRRSYRYYIPTE